MKALRFLFFCILLGCGMTACAGAPSESSTRSYILTTGLVNGELVYLGIGGEINGKTNPTLFAYPGETITVMLVNGGEGPHDIYIPGVNAKSHRVREKGERAIITFAVPETEIDLEYYDSTGNNAVIGMAGILRVSTDLIFVEDQIDQTEQIGPQSGSVGQNSNAGEQLFVAKCAGCHTIGGGRLVGPDLGGVFERREKTWLVEFISQPDKMIASGDPIAEALLEEYNNLAMPNLALSDQEVDDLLAYLSPQSGETASPVQEPTSEISPAPATIGGDPVYGEYLFSGKVALRNGGTPCIACHSAEGVGLIGGGALGPDLTHAYNRFGEVGLTAALSGLPFPTMQGIFADRQLTDSEQANLLAFFREVDQNGEPGTQTNLALILGTGSGLTIALLGIMLIFWPRQRMSLSRRLRKQGKYK